MSNLLDKWSVRTLDMFDLIREFGYKHILICETNAILPIGLPEAGPWIAHNDNEAKP